MKTRTRLCLSIVAVALFGLGIFLWMGPGQAMDTNPCKHDCPLAIVNAQLTVEGPTDSDGSTGTAVLNGVIVPPRDCASAAIAIDVFREAPSAPDGAFLGHGAATAENLKAGTNWPFEITVAGFAAQDTGSYYYELSELRCLRVDD